MKNSLFHVHMLPCALPLQPGASCYAILYRHSLRPSIGISGHQTSAVHMQLLGYVCQQIVIALIIQTKLVYVPVVILM